MGASYTTYILVAVLAKSLNNSSQSLFLQILSSCHVWNRVSGCSPPACFSWFQLSLCVLSKIQVCTFLKFPLSCYYFLKGICWDCNLCYFYYYFCLSVSVSIRDLGMVPYIKIFLDEDQYRGPTLSILEQLAEINADEFMSTAIGALCSSTQQELRLKQDLLQVLKVHQQPQSRTHGDLNLAVALLNIESLQSVMHLNHNRSVNLFPQHVGL